LSTDQSSIDRAASAAQTSLIVETRRVHRISTKNWFLLAGVSMFAVLGLVASMYPLLSQQLAPIWPWPKTISVLLAGISLAMCVLIVHLTRQQGRASQMQFRLLELEEKAKRDARRHYARLFALSNVSEIMGAKNDVEDIFDRITSLCVEAFDADTASLMLFDQETGDLFVRAASSKSARPDFIGARQEIGSGIAGWAAQHRQALLLNKGADLSHYAGLKWEDENISASMVVPIIVRDELVGVINVTSQTPDTRYESEDIQTLQVFALNAGSCIRHAEQIRWLRQMSGVPA